MGSDSKDVLSLTTVQNIELDPSGSPIEGVRVDIVTNEPAAMNSGNGSVIGSMTVFSDASGNWSVNLIPSASLLPAGTAYIFTRTYPQGSGGREEVDYGIVPTSSTPITLASVIVSSPVAQPITSSELAYHLQALDPHPQYFNQVRGDARYALAGSGGSGGSSTLAGDTDVVISSPNDTQVLTYEASSGKWKNKLVTTHSVTDFATPTADLGMGSHKITGLTKGTAATDAAALQNITDHANSATDPHAAASYLIGVNAGRHIYGGDSTPTDPNQVAGDTWVGNGNVYRLVGTTWTPLLTLSSTAASTPPVPAVNPTPAVGTDTSADINNAIDEWFAEYMDSSFRVIQKDESVTKVTSESTAYGLLFAALRGDQTKFDGIRNWANTNLKRSTLGETRGVNLWAWHYEIGTGVADHNWASDAEYDRVIALAQAYQLWGRQQDLDELKALHDDLKTYTLNTDEGRYYQTSDSFQQSVTNGHHSISGGTTWEVGGDYMNPLAYRILYSYSADPVWTGALNGAYDYWTKVIASNLGGSSTAGIFADWTDYSTNTHQPGPLTNGTNGWTYSQDTQYSYNSMRAPFRIAQDALYYSETRAKTLLGGAFKTWAQNAWASTNKFVDTYNHDGTTTSTTQKLHMAYGAYFALYVNNAADATAASIKSTWLTNLKVTGSYGTYFKDSPTSTASTYFGNAWMIFGMAMDSGLYAKMSQVTAIAGKYSAAAATTVGTSTTPPSSTYTVPAGSVKLYVDPSSQIASYATNSSYFPTATAVSRAQWLAGVPQVYWSGNWDNGSFGSKVADAVSKGAWFQVAIYNIPNRDLGGASSFGASTGASAYLSFINACAASIGTANAIIIYEPDAIPQMLQAYQAGSQTQAEYNARLSLMQQAITVFRNQCPNARIYVDSAHSAWFPDPTPLVAPLQQVQVQNAHGISVNVSNFRTTAEIIPWANTILSKLNIPYLGWVADVGRNGGNNPQGADWENPGRLGQGPSGGRRFGVSPQYGGLSAVDAKCHGLLWVKRPGESDGNAANSLTSNGWGAPAAGQFDPQYLWAPGVADESTTAGMLQRSPTPGVAGGAGGNGT